MRAVYLRLFTLAAFANAAQAGGAAATTTSVAVMATGTSAVLGGVKYVNKGLVAFGRILPNATESTGDTIGGIGSAMVLKRGTWAQHANGSYTGTLVMQPDRGFNVIAPIDYQARRHEIAFVLTPYYAPAPLTFAQAVAQTLVLTYVNTTLHFERNHTRTSGLDPLATRAAQTRSPTLPLADPVMPIASLAEPHLVVDAEGLVQDVDGTFWTSDEYGPYIYHFAANGSLIQTIQPPAAILPMINGTLNFTSETNPDTGRQGNQGTYLSWLSFWRILYAVLQSGTVQDGAGQVTRLFAYDLTNAAAGTIPLVGEWVLLLPVISNGKVEATSEIHLVSDGVFLCLSRDGNGHGGSGTKFKYKQADLFSIANATDIHGTRFDSPAFPVAPGGVLDPAITPVTYVGFVNYVNATDLARFGLHTGDPDDNTLPDSKWESLALAPVGDPLAPDDYFLFTASDNDFLTTQGVSLGVPYDAGEDVDNQFMVFRVTLPGAAHTVALTLGL
ncbi:unnamed protein product [Mycena citricolor]|uniref:Phytase-like domain-containing protein n=1 Tax=Mycena citricolor TaxID=2018698 RepID=A0AAD2Q3Q0_9AGAR|nr:unnamed protein product [Mycena citricolor]